MFRLRERTTILVLAAVLAGICLPATHGQISVPVRGRTGAVAPESPPLFRRVVKVGMTVSDLDRSLVFYQDVLSFQKVSEREVAGKALEQETGVFGVRCRIAEMKLGDETLELTQYLAASTPGKAYPADSRSHDQWFQHIAIITSDMDAAYAKLRANKVTYGSTGPQTLPQWNKNAAGIKAFYFRDPDGHVLETLQFPQGKGEARWQSKQRLFLGIDHTAIVVQDTDKSLAFYRDLCGMTIVGGSENYGDEQEHLNNVEGAHLRITTLKAASGPAVELLEYQQPRDGRPYPADAKPNDLLHWQTTITVTDAATAWKSFSEHGITPSRRPVRIPEASGLQVPTFLLGDPDGHVLQIESEN
jgi:catechol 2,3-dioxygenase-like lactoylglutathione lyase family enzyme